MSDSYVNDSARKEEIARAEEVLARYRSRMGTSGVESMPKQSVVTASVVNVGRKIENEGFRTEEKFRQSPSQIRDQGYYQSERRRVIQDEEQDYHEPGFGGGFRQSEFEPNMRSRRVIQDFDDQNIQQSGYSGSWQQPVSQSWQQPVSQSWQQPISHTDQSISDTHDTSMTTTKRKGVGGVLGRFFHKKEPAVTTPERKSFDDHYLASQEPFEIVYARVLVQRWSDQIGRLRDFRDEGLYTTLKIYRSTLFNRGLTQDHTISSFFRSKNLLLDDIIDIPARTQIKNMLGLSPQDNIRLEMINDPTSVRDYGTKDYASRDINRVDDDTQPHRGLKQKFAGTIQGIKSKISRPKDTDVRGEQDEYGDRFPNRRVDEGYGDDHVSGDAPHKGLKGKLHDTVDGFKYAFKGPRMGETGDEIVEDESHPKRGIMGKFQDSYHGIKDKIIKPKGTDVERHDEGIADRGFERPIENVYYTDKAVKYGQDGPANPTYESGYHRPVEKTTDPYYRTDRDYVSGYPISGYGYSDRGFADRGFERPIENVYYTDKAVKYGQEGWSDPTFESGYHKPLGKMRDPYFRTDQDYVSGYPISGHGYSDKGFGIESRIKGYDRGPMYSENVRY